MVGELSPALSSRLHGRAGPPHKTLATWRYQHHDVPRSHQKDLTDETTKRRRQSSSSKPPDDSLTKFPRRDNNPHDHQKNPSSRLVRPYISGVPTLRSSPFSAPPPFQLLREASRKGRSLVPSASFHEPTNGERSASPFPHTKRGENRREKSAHHWRFLLGLFTRVSRIPSLLLLCGDGFMSGEGCNVGGGEGNR